MPVMNPRSAGAWLTAHAADARFTSFIETLLLRMCEQPSIPGPDLRQTAQGEARVFSLIEEALRDRALPGDLRRIPIRRDIADHPSFTFPYYAGTADAYGDRSNLVHSYEPTGSIAPGKSVAINAHIDTVAPFFAPRVKKGRLFGRGACDDKGGCAAIIGALSLLRSLGEDRGIWPKGRILSMFVIDEETGGNGSLSLALDDSVAGSYDTLLVVESTEGQLHPANRGAVWYKVELPGNAADCTRLAMETVRELELAGKMLRDESDHPLFPDRPVQTCHGVLGPFGEHPSAICGKVAFVLHPSGGREEIRGALDSGLADYLRLYGDKTRVLDARTGKPKVARHYDFEERSDSVVLTVWGCTGHMGSILENDGAITKAAFMLLAAWEKIPDFQAVVQSANDGDRLVMEGGQGFLPTHAIEDVEARIADAVRKAHDSACARPAHPAGEPRVSFDKLHNDAFDGAADSEAMHKGLCAARACAIPIKLPVVGLKVSCDARLFARRRPLLPVITVGPGTLEVAHSDSECIDLEELSRSSAFLALYMLLLTGSLTEE